MEAYVTNSLHGLLADRWVKTGAMTQVQLLRTSLGLYSPIDRLYGSRNLTVSTSFTQSGPALVRE